MVLVVVGAKAGPTVHEAGAARSNSEAFTVLPARSATGTVVVSSVAAAEELRATEDVEARVVVVEAVALVVVTAMVVVGGAVVIGEEEVTTMVVVGGTVVIAALDVCGCRDAGSSCAEL